LRQTKIEDLRPWENNPRVNEHAVDAVGKSIEAFGFNVPILCDQDGTIIAGHTRWKAAKKLGLEKIPTIVLHLNAEQRKAFSIADNKTAEIANWDFPKLREVFDDLRSEEINLHSLGFSDEDLRRILLHEEEDENELPQFPEVAKTKPGDLFELGRHRLICGDASDEFFFHKLISNNVLDLIIASPPRFNHKGMGNWKTIDSHIRDIRNVVELCAQHLKPGGVAFWNIGSSSSTHHNLPCLHAQQFEKAGMEYLDAIAWARSGANFSVKRSAHIVKNKYYYPAHQWEPILVYRKPGPMPRMNLEGSRYMADFPTDLWEVAAVTNPLDTNKHPAVGPVEIPFRAIMAYTQKNACVLDPFAGSGTTLIAAEKSDRRALLIEINPVFCDVIIERWERVSKKNARFLSIEKE